MSPSPTDRRALAWMLAGAALIGTNGLMVRFADTPPTISAFYRMLFAGVLLVLYVRLSGRWVALPRALWAWSLLPTATFAADLWLWHRSILLVGPGLATLLANTQVFFMALAGVWFYRERIGPRFLAGIALAFAGLWLLLGGNWAALPDGYRWGVWLGLATGVAYAAYNLGLKRMQHEALVAAARRDPDAGAPVAQVLAMVSLGCAGLLALVGVGEGASFTIPSLRSLAILLALAAFGHCLSWILISKAMRHLSVALIGLLLLLQPIVAFLLDVLLLDRATTPREWWGLAFSLAGIFLASLKGRTRLPEPSV